MINSYEKCLDGHRKIRRTDMAIDSAVTMKRILRFAIGLLVNVFILFILVKVFAFGFSFAYDVFASNNCKDKSDTR